MGREKMFKKIFKKISMGKESDKVKSNNCFIVAQLNEKIMPIDRGELYEEPLDEFLKTNGYGEVTGGGTMQTKSGEIEFCDIEILVYQSNDIIKVSKEIINKLETLGAPKGSKLQIEKTNDIIPFGQKEGLAIFLDGVNLLSNVYKECDSNFVLSELSGLIGYDGNVQRYWQGNTETALYFYGESFVEMNRAISEFINTYPLCEGARIVQIA